MKAFTAYSENLFLDFSLRKEAAAAYVIGLPKKKLKKYTIIGPYNV